MAELQKAGVFHGVHVFGADEVDTTVTCFNGLITDLQTAMKSRFTCSGDTDHLNWVGFLNLHNWPIRGWTSKQKNFTG